MKKRKKSQNRYRISSTIIAVAAVLALTFTAAFSAWSLAGTTQQPDITFSEFGVQRTLLPGMKRMTFSPATDLLRVEGSSVELDLGISVFLENGRLAEGFIFEFKITSVKDPAKIISVIDDDMDGQVYVEKIDEGEYTVEMIEREGINAPDPVVVTVEPKVTYEKVDVSGKVKKQNEIVASEEDSKYGGSTNNNGGSSTPPPSKDTVEYVESSKSMTTKTSEKPILDKDGKQVYKYKPQLSANGYLIDAAGAESDIIPVVDASGYIIGAKRLVPSAEGEDPQNPQYADCTAEVLDVNGAPLMNGSNYKYRFEKIALTETVTETIITYKGWQTIDGRTYYYDKNGKFVTGWQTIQGIQYFFSNEGVRGGSVGIDVSTWQENIDWKKVKAAGIDFAFIRLGFRGYGSGALVLDNEYKSHMQGAIAAGIKIGVYFFTQAINEREAVEEASMCLQYVSGYKLTYPIAIDIEDAGSSNARTNSLTTEQRTKICIAFCETIRNAGYTAAVYANKYYFTSLLNTSQLNKYVIWLAHYTTASSSSYTGRYDIWQHSSTGRVNGINGNVDMNISYLGY